MSLLKAFTSLSRDLKLLFLSNFLWTSAYGLYVFIFPIYMRNLGAAPDQVGLVYTISLVIAAASLLPGGLIADRFDRKWVQIASLALNIPVPVLFTLASSWVQLLPALFMFWASIFATPAFNSYVTGAAASESMMTSFAAVYSALFFGMAVSPAAGGYLLAVDPSYHLLFYAAALLYASAAAVALFIRSQKASRPAESARFFSAFRARSLLSWLLLLGGAAFAYSISTYFIPLLLSDRDAFRPVLVQSMGSLRFLGAAVLSVALGRLGDSRRSSWPMLLSFTTFVLALILLASQGSAPLVALAMFLLGAGDTYKMLGYALVGPRLPDEVRGRSFSVYDAVQTFAGSFGPCLGGFLYTWSYALPLAATAAIFAGLTPLLITAFRPTK